MSEPGGVRAKSQAIASLVDKLQKGEITKQEMFTRLAALKNAAVTKTPARPPVPSVTFTSALPDAPTGPAALPAPPPPPPPPVSGLQSPDPAATELYNAANHMLSPSADDEQVLSSPDRRQIIQQLLAEKRKVRDAAIDSATKFTTNVNSAMHAVNVIADDNGAMGQTLSMNDLETVTNNDTFEDQTPPPPPVSKHASSRTSYQSNLRNHVNKTSGSKGGVGAAAAPGNTNTPPSVKDSKTKPRATLAQEPHFMSRRASDEMKDRKTRALKEEMMAECTFSPSIRTLPPSYGKPKRMEGDFSDRAARWAQEREHNLSASKQRAQDNELEDCTFTPKFLSNALASSRGGLGRAERVENGAVQSTEQETVQRLYYVETKKLEERRNREALEHKRKQDEEFRKSCTFQPDLSSKGMAKQNELLQQATSRYMTSSTQAAERRQLVLAHQDLASPGPGEYTEDREPERFRSGGNNVFDPLMLGFSGAGMRMGGANSTASKSWSFAPKTNEINPKMGKVQEYLKEDVITRLNNLARPEHKFAMSKAAAEEAEDELQRSSQSRSKDVARKDFHEFLARQNALQIKKKEHKENLIVAETPGFNPRISKKSKEIHEQNNRGTFLQRVERNESKRENMINRMEHLAQRLPEECTFQPSILRKSADLPVRSAREMSLGDAENREINTRALRLKVESEELSQYSFRPTMNSTAKKSQSTLKVVYKPETYMSRLKEAQDKKDAYLEKLRKDNEQKELAECTFTPNTTECPAYVKRIAHSMQISRKHRERFGGKKEPMPSWK